ncbi:DUF547 domain-containing protein [Aureispira anguillae]|uniref:DUF547 domain-containing protein n=1 Tax=Aureispira anguillae TaxID=2864201 RepID=A0A916DW73_9BACT|nr:DUF547 domain-containing protein [Aureispira anguillae]BDS14350.1 DUF547 domain-containing protein [Aureispira anguillae]
MKRISIYLMFFLAFYSTSIKGQTLNAFFEQSNLFFTTYAHHNRVQYKVLQNDGDLLNTLTDQLAKIDLKEATVIEQKAFYINAYNLLVIKNIVVHYPIASPNEIVEFWDELTHEIAGERYTLERLKEKILAQFSDPLLHFVLVDGTVSAAPIANFAYMPTKLKEQLENRTIEALNSSKFIEYNQSLEEVVVPALFKAYPNSFQPSILGFINQYRVQKIPTEAQLRYAFYDGTINAFYENTAAIVQKKNKKKKKNKIAYSPLAQVITLPKGSTELSLFNSIYTVTYGDKVLGSRNSYFNSYFTAFHGITGKLDIGATFLLRSSRENDLYETSPFKVFEFERTPIQTNYRSSGTYSDWGLSHIGFQVRFAPFKNINLSFEQGLLLPVQNLPKENTVDNSLYSITQVYYIQPFSAQLQLFLALTYWQPIRSGETFKFQPPLLRGFLNYFATPRFSVFVTTMYFLEWGAGVKFMLTPKFEIQAMYSYYLPIPGAYDVFSSGATSIMTYNMGLRYRF